MRPWGGESPSFDKLEGYVNCNFIYFAMALDGHLTRTHTTTNQKQAAIMEGRRERWCGHRGGENGEVKVFFIHSPKGNA